MSGNMPERNVWMYNFSRMQKVRLAVTDDGVGGEATIGGFGLLGVQERVSLLGGEFRVKPDASGGYEFVVEVPA